MKPKPGNPYRPDLTGALDEAEEVITTEYEGMLGWTPWAVCECGSGEARGPVHSPFCPLWEKIK